MLRKAPDIYEVCPRDGFQNIKSIIPTRVKVALIERLIASGVTRLQLTSFVSPKAVPQMADAAEVAQRVMKKYSNILFGALVPNLHGARAAWENGIREIVYVASVSESHNRANVNRTHEESFRELGKIRNEFPEMHIIFGAATSFACPFEGETRLDAMLRFVERAVNLGASIIELSDTTGMAYPAQVELFFEAVKKAFPGVKLGVHFHDTRNNGVLNSWIAMQYGVDYIQTALGGLGGCPFAPGASGNTSTEDLVWLLNRSGYETGIDFAKLLASARFLRQQVNGNYSGHHINIQCVTEKEQGDGKNTC